MAFEIRHTNSAGTPECQTVATGDVLSLIRKIAKMGGSEVLVIDARGDKWTAAEAEANLTGAGIV